MIYVVGAGARRVWFAALAGALAFSPGACAQDSSSRPGWSSGFRFFPASALARPVTYAAWLSKQERANPSFDWRGGVLVGSAAQSDAARRDIKWSEDPDTLAMEWQTSAPKFELLCAPSGGSWRVLERGASESKWITLGGGSSAGCKEPRVQLFSETSGARRARRFRVEYSSQLAWGIRLEQGETIVARPPFPALRRVVWCGDSFIEGVAGPSMWQGFAGQASEMLGLDAHFDGSGGTGYLSDGAPTTGRARYGGRLSNIVAGNPSLVVVYGSTNDLSFPVEQVALAAKKHWSAIRRALPAAQIVVIGPLRMGSDWKTGALSDALKAAATQSGLPFVDASNWITGTGKEDDRRGDGNADRFRAKDGTHPTPAGHTFIAHKIAEAMRPLIAGK